MKWDNGTKEKLFHIAVKFDNEILLNEEVTMETAAIKSIAEVFGDKPGAVLYQLADMGIVKANRRTSYKSGTFYQRDSSASYFDFTINPKLSALSQEKITLLENEMIKLVRASFELPQVINKLASIFGLSELNIKIELFKAGLIIHTLGGRYIISSSINENEQAPIKSSLNSLFPPKPIMESINRYRAEASKLYQVSNHIRPCLIQSNDGTGFGKTYGVMAEFIKGIDCANSDYGFSNMIFVSPQKSQFDFDSDLVQKAYKKGLEFVAFLAMTDMTDLDFESWISDPTENKIENRKKYKNWVKAGKGCATLKKDLIRLAQSVNTIDSLNRRIETENKMSSDDFDTILELKNQLLEQRRQMEKTLYSLSLSAMNRGNDPAVLKDIFEAKEGIDALRSSIIRHCLPFAVAMVKPCIMLATTNKFDLNIRVPQKLTNGLYRLNSMPFDCIVGAKKHLTENETGSFSGKHHEEQVTFLKEHFLAKDESNFFEENNINFTVVIDEVHEAHKLFSESATASLITPEIQLAHVFAGVHRVYAQVNETKDEEIEFTPFYEEKKKFIDDVKHNLLKRCELSNEHNIASILNTFISNIDFVQIRHGDAEQIINLTRNAFCFTPKRYFNEEGLKRVRIRLAHGSGTCQLYYTTNEGDSTLSLHDVFQMTMAVLASASQIKGSSEFLKSLKQGGDSSQNYPLYKFMKKARTVVSEVNEMFVRSDNEDDLLIDHFYTYFQPKTVFSVVPQKDLEFKDPSLQKLTYVNFTLNLIKEQPEVSLLRMLYDTNNSVIALSATSGINGNITGQYNQPFLNKFCNEPSANLGINIVKRQLEDSKILVGLRESRAELRKVNFNIFDESAEKISDVENRDDFKTVFNSWYSRLKDFAFKLDDKYKRLEFKRQLSAWLLCSFDKKHTLSLALSGGFMSALRKYAAAVQSKQVMSPSGFRVIEKQGRVFQVAPFSNRPSIKTILFNADLNKEEDVRDFVKVNNNDVKLAFISTYRSAGTGLNYFARYPNEVANNGEFFEVDFERLVLINSPFWSQIIKDSATGDKSLYSLANCLSIMKRISDSREAKKLKDFEINLVHGEDYRFLNYEHELELLKVLMQAIGRVERKDANMTSEIYLSSDVADLAAVQFSRLARDTNNTILFESMSLLNYRFKSECRKRSVERGFSSNESRLQFEEEIRHSGEILQEFFDITIPEILGSARQGNSDAIEFNEKLRSVNSIQDPAGYIAELRRTTIAKNDSFVGLALDHLYIDLTGERENLTLCRNDQTPEILTDIMHGDSLYRPENQVSLDYSRKMEFKQENLVTSLIRESAEVTNNVFKAQVPHPKFLALLKGNMGEFVFSLMLNKLDITPLSNDEVIDKIGSRAYELFDYYIEVGTSLVCVDVKNWSSILDKTSLSQQTHRKAISKIKTISDYVDGSYERIDYVYLNGRLENNALNHEQEKDKQSRLFYLNLFKENSGYAPSQRRNTQGELTEYYSGSHLKQKIVLNPLMLSLLQGTK